MSLSDGEIQKKASALRRDFHKYPESGWTEFRTTAKIADTMEFLGYKLSFSCDFVERKYIMGRASDEQIEHFIGRAEKQGADKDIMKKMKGFTGLVAELDTGRCGPVTVFRFDIDCVEVSETQDKAHLPNVLGFSSVNTGLMHACAHDGHAAVGLVLAEILQEQKEALCGKIRFVFQPAEEGVRGGYAFVKSGAADGADYFIAMHLGLGFHAGTVCCGCEGFLFTTKLDADVKGVAAHAGKEPEKGKNALLAAAEAALSIHSMPDCTDGRALANVGVLNAGTARNVTAPNAYMKIETRGENEISASFAYSYTVTSLQKAAQKYGVELKISKQGESVAAQSDNALAGVIFECISGLPCVKTALLHGSLCVSDDACWYMKEVQSHGGLASYICVGADIAAGHHNDKFDFDEEAMLTAVKVLEHTAVCLNSRG